MIPNVLKVALGQAMAHPHVEEVVDARVLVGGVVAVAQRVGLAAARAADRVVVATRGAGDGEHRTSFVGQQHAARDEEDVALRGDRVRRRVPLDRVVCAVGEEVDRLVAAQVDDGQRVPAPYDTRPRRARRHLFVEHGAHARSPRASSSVFS